MVNRYANDRMAQKYKNAVTIVSTVLSVGPNDECIFSMEIGISLKHLLRTMFLSGFPWGRIEG